MTVEIQIEIDTEIDTEIEILMEIGTETEITSYGDIAVANVATSPIRSRLAMTRWERRRGVRSASRGPTRQWVPTGRVRFPSADDARVGNAAVAAGGVPEETAVASGGALDEEAAVAARGEGAVPTLEEAVHNAECECGLSGSEQEKAIQNGDDTRSVAVSVTTFNDADSVLSDADAAPGHDDAAVAAGHDDAAVTRLSTRKPRGRTPAEQDLQSRWAARNDASHVGNIGWVFGNWGKRPSNAGRRNCLDKVLKKQLAMFIGLSECQAESEDVLKRDPAERDPAAVAGAAQRRAKGQFKHRPEFKYLTLRGNEEESLLIAVR